MKNELPKQDHDIAWSRMFRNGQTDVIKVDPVTHELAPKEAAEVERKLQEKARG